MVRCGYVTFHAIHCQTKKQGYANFLSAQHVRVINPTKSNVTHICRNLNRPRIYKKGEDFASSQRRHEVQRPLCARPLPCCFRNAAPSSVAYSSVCCDCEDLPI
jgi:hypothetical protein